MSSPLRLSFVTLLALIAMLWAGTADAQTYAPRKARRQWVSVSTDWLRTQPLHFLEHPLQELVGRPVAAAQFQSYDYRTRDEAIQIDVLEFSREGRGASIAVYPLGLSVGPTLGLRLSRSDLPTIRVAFAGSGAPQNYTLEAARAYDFGAALYVADHSPGWGLGSHAFVGGGVGRIKSELSDGDRVFAEGGGGINSGPFGVDLSVKFAWNHLPGPVDHHFLTVPITVRGTLTF